MFCKEVPIIRVAKGEIDGNMHRGDMLSKDANM